MGHIPLEYNVLIEFINQSFKGPRCTEHTHINRSAIISIVIDHIGDHGNTLYGSAVFFKANYNQLISILQSYISDIIQLSNTLEGKLLRVIPIYFLISDVSLFEPFGIGIIVETQTNSGIKQ